VLLALFRISLILSFKHRNPTGENILKWERPFAFSLFTVFLVWNVGILMVIPSQNLYSIFIVSTFSIGLATGAVSWYGHIRYIQLTSLCIALIPIITALLTFGLSETLWVGVAACFLFISCMLTSLTYQKTLNGNMELNYDLEQSRKNAEVMARTDVLTGLNNRRAFFDSAQNILNQCIEQELPASILMFDLDHFKKINDEHGHAGGDIALQHVAELLKNKLRASDVSCRFGGEEFVVLLPNTVLEEARITAEKLRSLIASKAVILSPNKATNITASFGVSDTGNTIDAILHHADQAMYEAKSNGRNRVCVYKPANLNPSNNVAKLKSDKCSKVRESLSESVQSHSAYS